ncbi:hypothetical protein Fmac_028412 [Flemingia macrophylla]|uniref:Uncharacterized protein n=1 Tax=Flemingia macrophylla TaxID=520843 RepID=A0ABD1L7V1_9FABA
MLRKILRQRGGFLNFDCLKFFALSVEKPIGRQFHDTQSEIADNGFGRHFYNTDPRFSLKVCRFSLDTRLMSFDDPSYSIDEPRAS